jgi:hypothetical protein
MPTLSDAQIPMLKRSSQNKGGSGSRGKISDELVHILADKVYAMLVADLVIEKERRPPLSRTGRSGHAPFQKGGL